MNYFFYGIMINIEHLTGGAGNDILTGNAGLNKIDGGAGSDILAGGLGNDQMWAGAGSDRLIADGGNDELSGNYSFQGYGDNASDIFDIRTSAGTVTITDFEIGVDKLDFTDFNLGNSSYWTGSAVQSAPSVTTLNAAEGILRNMTNAAAATGNAAGRFLLVPPTEYASARVLSESMGGWPEVVTSAWFPSGYAYLLADPLTSPTFTRLVLGGRDLPRVFPRRAPLHYDGMALEGELGFGFAVTGRAIVAFPLT